MIYDCIITGAGAAGLFCGSVMKSPVNGLILEKTGRAGTKLLMSGNGQCNITHSGSIKDFIQCYGKNGGRIRKSLYKYSNISLTDFLREIGVNTFDRGDGKIFPVSMDAHDILKALLRKTAENGFDIRYETPVRRIEKTSAGWQVHSDAQSFTARALVIASGGCSYPSTGSDGSLFHVLKRDLGVEITELRPALSSVQLEDYPYGELSGISFENAGISIWRNGKKLAENHGGLLFTHRDISGPAVMNISKLMLPGDEIRINYLAPMNFDKAFDTLKKASHGAGADPANIIASEFRLPKRFCRILACRSGSSLKALARQMTGEAFTVASVSGFNSAMTTSGGVELSQLALSSMEFKEHPGLFAAGEVLDIDGITGGYNLQFAYSSACAAADGIISNLKKS